MTTEQRLDRVEDDLTVVRQLLASAATYGESANRRLDRVGEKLDQAVSRQDATDAQIAQLLTAQTATDGQIAQLLTAQTATDARIGQLLSAQTATDAKLDQLTERVDHLTVAQNRTQTQLDQLSSRLDEFIFHTQRIFNQQATVLERADGRSERLEVIITRLDRNYEEQKSEFREFQRTTGAALERIDRVLDYLLRQQGGDAR
ncbi:MAG: 6-aminohexanoate hydrolase [Trichormus sp. ATA11-4-KO1]|jgi:chromosome segregation ATPase|nr:6-aminohexanoate hydrolase [Trichormus sp. ATA11-4-KO1]